MAFVPKAKTVKLPHAQHSSWAANQAHDPVPLSLQRCSFLHGEKRLVDLHLQPNLRQPVGPK